MRIILIGLGILLGSLLGLQNATALVETRVTYGTLSSSPDLNKVDVSFGEKPLPILSATKGVGADVLVLAPLIGLGAGLRYENVGFNINSNKLSYKTTSTRTSLLVN